MVTLLPLQLLKYVPTSDEVEALEGNSAELSKFAVADRFLFEMSRCVQGIVVMVMGIVVTVMG